MFCLKLTVQEDLSTEVIFHPVVMKEEWPYADTSTVLGQTVTIISALEISVLLLAKLPNLQFNPVSMFTIISTPMECLDGDDKAVKAFIELLSSFDNLMPPSNGTVH
jgi:hypothetical protein